jgi:hypothetical protein
MKGKNDLAEDLNFELLMLETHRFPDIDLAPTPWMQWLYELGILGLVIGPLVYSWLTRAIEKRIRDGSSYYEVFLWLQILAVIIPPEHTTDNIVVSARSALILALAVASLAQLLRWTTSFSRLPGPAH